MKFFSHFGLQSHIFVLNVCLCMFFYNNVFLDASASLSEALSVGRSVHQSVGWLVMLSPKSMKNGLLRILND